MPDAMVPRQLQLLGATGAIRAASYDNRDHLVVPCVALMQGVIWPVNAQTPEFVPVSVLRQAPQGWNGRPCVGDHPARGRALISANEPAVLEAESFGHVFGARIVDDRLVVEAWLDPAKAQKVGRAAVRVLERVRAGEPVEVSVGAFVTTEMTDGSYNGKPYKAKWTSLVPDHLALLPEGTRGACSVAMGCGMPRGAKAADGSPLVPRYAVTVQGLAEVAEDRVLFDPSQPRVPAGSPNGGQWTSGDGGGSLGPNTEEQQRAVETAEFQRLKSEWAKKNNELLNLIDQPTSPEAVKLMGECKDLCKQMFRLRVDPGGVEGIGKPGGDRDLVVVGAGPGGLAASVLGATDGLDTLVIDSNLEVGGQSRFSSRIENFPGFPVGSSGERLAAEMHQQAQRLGAEFKLGVRVTGLRYDPETDLKTLTLSNGETITARAVVIAGGVEFRQPTFPGASGKGIIVGDPKPLRMATADQSVVIAGGSNGAAQAALAAAQRAASVTLVSRSPIAKSMSDYQIQQLRNHPKIRIIEGDDIERAALDGNGRVNAIFTRDGKEIPASLVGVFFGGAPRTEWLPKELQRDERGKIHTDQNKETTVPGVFAAGDVRVGSIGRVGTAVGDGQYAEAGVWAYFKRVEKQPGVFQRKKPKTTLVPPIGLVAARARGTITPEQWDRFLDRAFAADTGDEFFGQTIEADDPTLRDNFDASQPRVPAGSPDGGQWTADGGGGGSLVPEGQRATGTFFPPSTDETSYRRANPVQTDNINRAIELIIEGRVVELPDAKAAHTVITKLAAMAQEAKAAGRKAKDYDLCNVSVAGTNLFCHDYVKNKRYPEGIPRIEMPQFSGEPRPGSPASRLPRLKNPDGSPGDRVDGAGAFMAHLERVGIKVTNETELASRLRASQREMIGGKVAAIMLQKEFDPAAEPIFVSRDNYVIDGHHRWAAVVGRDLEDGRLGDAKMPVIRVDAPMSEILFLSKRWTKVFGIQQAGGPSAAKPKGASMAELAALMVLRSRDTDAPSAAQMKVATKLRAKLASLFAGHREPPPMPRTLSDADLRQALMDAIGAVHPDSVGLAKYDREASTVIFGRDTSTSSETDAEVAYFQSGFVLLADGKVGLTGDPEPMEATVTFAAAGGCGCKDKDKETAMHRNADRIQALVSHPKTPFEAADVPFLEGLSDERFTALEAAVIPTEKVEEKAEAKVEAKVEEKVETKAAEAKPQTEEEFLAAHPNIAAIVSQHKAAEARKRTGLLEGLKATAKDVYSEAELAGMSTDQLEKLARFAKVETTVDYAGVGAPRAAAASTAITEAPDPWAAALSARKGA